MKQEVTKADIEQFLKATGRRGERVLSVLGKTTQFYNAMTHPLGQELLSDIVSNMEYLLEKIVNEEASDKDRADYRAFRNIALSWGEKIAKHLKKIEQVKYKND